MKKGLIFVGALEAKETSTSIRLAKYLKEELENHQVEVNVFKTAESGIPLFNPSEFNKKHAAAERMNELFRDADFHIWLTPLYHGSMTGAMKNCLDWLEISAKEPVPYLTGKVVGLVCWADGVQAIHGINAMYSVAKSLRAWVAPYSVAIQHKELFDENGELTEEYKNNFKKLIELLTWKC